LIEEKSHYGVLLEIVDGLQKSKGCLSISKRESLRILAAASGNVLAFSADSKTAIKATIGLCHNFQKYDVRALEKKVAWQMVKSIQKDSLHLLPQLHDASSDEFLMVCGRSGKVRRRNGVNFDNAPL